MRARYGRALVASVTLVQGTALIPFLAGALAVQLQGDLGFADRELGLAVTIYFGISAMVSPFSGGYADRTGWRRSLRVSAVLAIITLTGIAVTVDDFASLAAWMVIGGIGHGFGAPTSNLILVEELPPHRHGLAFGIKQASPPMASILAGLAVPAVALTIGWRWAFGLALAIPPIALWASFMSRLPGQATRKPAPPTTDDPEPRTQAYLRLALLTGIGTLGSGPIITFTVRTLVESGVGNGLAGTLFAVASVIALLVRVGGGHLCDRRGIGGIPFAGSLLAVGAAGMVLLAIGTPATTIAGTFVALGAGWGWFGLLLLGVAQVAPRRAGRMTGVMMSAGAAGAAIGPFAFGVLADAWGFGPAWSTMVVTTAVSAGLILRQSSAWAPGRWKPTSAEPAHP
ncbi:MAG TPA: MFS transporter [Acidimicrobiia bacterium]|nr:MFS transporter [Acidimicrobiia bacterium]